MVDRRGDGVADELLALRMGEHRDAAEPLRQLLDADDVVVVMVGEQDVGDPVPSRSTRSQSGSVARFESISTPVPPTSSTAR